MRHVLLASCLTLAFTVAAQAQTAAPAPATPAAPASPTTSTPPAIVAPAGPVTATCKDGSTQSGRSRISVCVGHGGIQTGAASATASAPAAATSSGAAAARAQAPGGGPGQVWVNSSTKVYHCMGDKYYGKTHHGRYMTEEAAKAAGNHADAGKTCS